MSLEPSFLSFICLAELQLALPSKTLSGLCESENDYEGKDFADTSVKKILPCLRSEEARLAKYEFKHRPLFHLIFVANSLSY